MGLTYKKIYKVVAKIPRGRVATYGQIAAMAGIPGQPRQVGYALNALPDGQPIPWHRVINAKGQISKRSEPECEKDQHDLLKREGIEFDANSRISLSRFGWRPKQPRAPRASATRRPPSVKKVT